MFGDAEAYDRFMGRWSRLLAPLLVDFADIPDSGRVLDVGSGTGSLAFAIADRKPHSNIVGIDPSREYVEYAGSRSQVRPRVSFETGDARYAWLNRIVCVATGARRAAAVELEVFEVK